LIVNAEVVAVEAVPILALRVLQPVEDAGTYICWPEFVPHMTGGDLPPGTVTPKESVSQFPILVAAPAPAAATVMVVMVTGLFRTNVSKSSLSWHTSELHLQMVKEQEVPVEREELVK
jgi:hypothetical protein